MVKLKQTALVVKEDMKINKILFFSYANKIISKVFRSSWIQENIKMALFGVKIM